MSDLTLKTDFPAPSVQSWEAFVEKGLRGAGIDSLQRKTEDGIGRGPLMTASDLPPSLACLGRTELPLLDGRNWHIAAPVRDPDLGHANTQLLEDLKGGASAVRLEAGLDLSTRNNLKRLLEGVFTELVPIQFAVGTLSPTTFKHVQSLDRLNSSVVWAGLNPIENSGAFSSELSDSPETWRLMGIAPAKIHEAGGTDVQELAGLAAALAESMRLHGADMICGHMVVNLAADRDTHLTIAKFRAARRLIRRIAEAFDADGSAIPLCGVTSLRMMESEDAWTNLLRIMSAGTGAVIGGADMVTTRPFTDGLGQATPFAHRIARNMQLMMMEESHLGQVSDAAHGSYWHEQMTGQLAQQAWRAFQAIEALGGWSAYKDSGQFQSNIETSKIDREARNAPVLGVTLHPAPDVKAPEVRS